MTLPAPITQFLAMFRYIWRDSRVPLLAKVFVVLATFYWINPFDLISDLQPGGYCDDIVIFSLLVIIALRLVPKTVFQDSRNKALLGRKAAIIGTLYLTSTSIPCQARSLPVCTNLSTVCQSGQVIASVCRKAYETEIKQTTLPEKTAASHDLGRFAPDDNLCDCLPAVSYTARNTALVIVSPNSRHMSIQSHSPPVLLTTRGGQYQLYVSEDTSGASLAIKVACPIRMPSRLAGGIFVDAFTKSQPGDSSCC